MLQTPVQKALAELQTRTAGDSSLLEHLSALIAKTLESKDVGINLAYLSKLLKKQAAGDRVPDAILPYRPIPDVSSAKRALELFGCGILTLPAVILCRPCVCLPSLL
jgi:hypothetical protein